MRMKVKPLAAGMKHFDTSDLRTKIFLVPSQMCQGFRCAREKQPIQLLLIRQEDLCKKNHIFTASVSRCFVYTNAGRDTADAKKEENT
jgi:hypothetical protein